MAGSSMYERPTAFLQQEKEGSYDVLKKSKLNCRKPANGSRQILTLKQGQGEGRTGRRSISNTSPDGSRPTHLVVLSSQDSNTELPLPLKQVEQNFKSTRSKTIQIKTESDKDSAYLAIVDTSPESGSEEPLKKLQRKSKVEHSKVKHNKDMYKPDDGNTYLAVLPNTPDASCMNLQPFCLTTAIKNTNANLSEDKPNSSEEEAYLAVVPTSPADPDVIESGSQLYPLAQTSKPCFIVSGSQLSELKQVQQSIVEVNNEESEYDEISSDTPETNVIEHDRQQLDNSANDSTYDRLDSYTSHQSTESTTGNSNGVNNNSENAKTASLFMKKKLLLTGCIVVFCILLIAVGAEAIFKYVSVRKNNLTLVASRSLIQPNVTSKPKGASESEQSVSAITSFAAFRSSCMASKSSKHTPDQSGIISFDKVSVNVGSTCSLTAFTAPQSGIYWLMVSVAATAHSQLSISLASKQQVLQIKSFTPLLNHFVYMDAVKFLTQGETVYLTSNYVINSAKTNIQTYESVSLGGFRLDTIFSPLQGVDISIANQDTTAITFNGKDIIAGGPAVKLNTKDFVLNAVTLAVTGIYIMTFNWQIENESLKIRCAQQRETSLEPVIPDLVDSSHGSVVFLVQLSKNDFMMCNGSFNKNPSALRVPFTISHRVLLYSSQYGRKAAWAVEFFPWFNNNLQLTIPDVPVARINYGISYEASTRTVAIETSGTYYVGLTVQSPIFANTVGVVLNRNQNVISIEYEDVSNENLWWFTVHKFTLIHLRKGDSLFCMKTKKADFGTRPPHTYWTGLLLYPD